MLFTAPVCSVPFTPDYKYCRTTLGDPNIYCTKIYQFMNLIYPKYNLIYNLCNFCAALALY